MQTRAILFVTALGATPVVAQDPLSAIDWLGRAPVAITPPQPPATVIEPPATADATTPTVEVQPLDAASPSGVGLLPARVTGFPETLWAASSAETVAALLRDLPERMQVPAAQALMLSLLLAEATPPRGEANAFLNARLAALRARGATGPALEMIRLVPSIDEPALFRHWSDLALLNDTPKAACDAALSRPELAAEMAFQVYCAARNGQWDRAVTLLEAGRALGTIPPGLYGRLLRFLDPELAEDGPALAPPSIAELTPLDFRVLQATGEPLPSSALPLEFTVTELSGDSGWKARIEAAERLVRAGAIGEAQLFAAYTERIPSASGGVWDRAEAVQRFEVALQARDPAAVGTALQRVWPLMQRAALGVPFARHYAEQLASLPMTAPHAQLTLFVLLLAPDYETLTRDIEAREADEAFLLGLARGAPIAPPDAQARAIAKAWEGAVPPPELSDLVKTSRLGEALLRGLAQLDQGAQGDLTALTEALAFFRSVGLEDMARRTALQLRLARARAS